MELFLANTWKEQQQSDGIVNNNVEKVYFFCFFFYEYPYANMVDGKEN